MNALLAERLKALGADDRKIKSLVDLGLSDDTIAKLLDQLEHTEKEAARLGVRYKGATMKPSQEANILDRLCADAGWSIERGDADPIYDTWEHGGLAPALALVERCKSARVTPREYATRTIVDDPIAIAFQGDLRGAGRDL